MRAESIGNKQSREQGSSILEALIALAVLTLGISAVIMLVFANQTLKLDSETAGEALYKAKDVLEDKRALSHQDFNSVVPISFPLDSIYSKEFAAADLTPCRKEVTSRITWSTEQARPQKIELKTDLVDIPGAFALGSDCDSGITDDFDNPRGLVSEPLGGQGATSIDAVNNRLYVTSNKFPPLHNVDLFIYDFDPILVSLTPVAALDLDQGLNDVDVAGNYAYLASASTTGQLQVVDLAAMARIDSATRQLPETTTAIGQKIFFYNNKIYIGTQYLACPPTCPSTQNNEFHIYDVSTPSSPNWQGSVNINHNVNDIFVSGDFAYLATSDINHELMVININPSSSDYLKHPDDTGFGYDAPGSHDGSSVYILGNKVYLGRKQNTPSSSDDFFILNKNDVLDGVSTSDGLINSLDLGIQNGALVTGIIVRGQLAFIGLDDPAFGLKILNISTMLPPSACAGFNFPENSTGMDMSGNFIFTSNKSQDEIRVIYDQPTACIP